MHRKRNAFTLLELVVVVIIICTLMAFLMRGTGGDPRGEVARRNACHNHLKVIVLALLNYHETYGKFPPAYTVDAEGNRLHSWRTLILPWMEEQALYESIDFALPWNDPANSKAYASSVEWFQCPSTDLEPGMTTYLALVGTNWAFAGETSRKLDDIKDETISTMCILEADPKCAVHWMSPNDINETDGLPIDKDMHGSHSGVYLAAYFDGHVSPVGIEFTPERLRALLTVAGGEKVDSQ